ncbi:MULTISPECIES: hypothetical protein [Tepidiforma]|uniref:HEAT repeat domain-containing protein n=1 Tax=Tepidiforma bonchosmolovskayae TaxID=2601677 RepID=A0ABX6C4P9_9CHLR|nr:MULTISPECIES: hypothetical protein [Tepidiforma]QFG04244.1 hypothetical protein Tbon_13490 [Tepidiforma bonchosmolovskayae]
MERRLPPEYEGWQAHEGRMRRMTTPELVAEVQDGSPERRLAALSVINLADVEPAVVRDWIRTLPDAEANELAGAIPVLAPEGTCDDDARWAELAREGFDARRLPTFLVVLMASLEAMEARGCPGAAVEWERTADWLGDIVDRLAAAGDEDALDDISLFVFENYLDRDAIFEAFCGVIVRHEWFAQEVSANPSVYLARLPAERQRRALLEAAQAGGLPFEVAWANLRGS